jgi:hypothetical protein
VEGSGSFFRLKKRELLSVRIGTGMQYRLGMDHNTLNEKSLFASFSSEKEESSF